MNTSRYVWVALLAIAAFPAGAAEFKDYPDLPPLSAVTQALNAYPPVLGAQAGIKLEQSNQAKLAAGTYEYSLRLNAQRREVRLDPSQQFNEWDVGVERYIRLPGKSALDDKLGAQGVDQARLAHGDALHEAGRQLLKLWFEWVRATQTEAQWQGQVEALKQQLGIVTKRVQAGDAPQLEALLAEAAMSQAQAAQLQAQLRAELAAAELAGRFPAVALTQTPPLPLPEPLPQTLEHWREQVLHHNHELGFAHGEVQRWQLLAQRARADQTPDPALGVRYANERGGEERLIGLNLTIPLPGQARTASTQGIQAQAEIAVQKEAAVLARLNTETVSAYASANAAYATWNKSRDAAERMQRNADLASRAYQLGEAHLSDVLTARRQALESALGATLAQIDAGEARYRLMLDAHQLWPIDVDEDDEGHEHY
jgi:outer membrane protein TolC